MTSAEFKCVRCAKSEPRLKAAPVPGPAGVEVAEKICAACWQAWTEAEVMIINELRLNFMDPKSLGVLEQHMRDFLLLDGPRESA